MRTERSALKHVWRHAAQPKYVAHHANTGFHWHGKLSADEIYWRAAGFADTQAGNADTSSTDDTESSLRAKSASALDHSEGGDEFGGLLAETPLSSAVAEVDLRRPRPASDLDRVRFSWQPCRRLSAPSAGIGEDRHLLGRIGALSG